MHNPTGVPLICFIYTGVAGFHPLTPAYLMTNPLRGLKSPFSFISYRSSVRRQCLSTLRQYFDKLSNQLRDQA